MTFAMGPEWALLLTIAAQPLPELIILPPQPVEVKAEVATQVWKDVGKQIAKEKKSLGISLNVHNEAKDALAGPARDRAAECASKPECLADVGATFGADLLITGTVDKESVALVLIDVKAAKKLVGARSSKKLAAAGLKRQTQAAVKGLVRGYQDWKKTGATTPAPQAETMPDPPQSEAGEIRISSAELEGVGEVMIDGATVKPGPDGNILWVGPAGSHQVVAVKLDGTKAVHPVDVAPKGSVEVDLIFADAMAPPPPEPMVAAVTPPPEEPSGGEDVTGEWWFWTSLGAAVAVGGTTAVLLLGGTKGGPELGGGGIGAISGTY